MKLPTLKSSLPTLRSGLQQVPRFQGTQRLRGRAAVDRRARWLYAHPLCCKCEAQGLTTAAITPDHIIPLWKGGADNESNLQSLCREHHDEKTAAEAAERAALGASPSNM